MIKLSPVARPAQMCLLFSVVIPAYKRPDSLALCLAALSPSVQMVPAASYEVIVSDDSPEGETMKAIVEARFPWAQWVPGPRKGPAANRNNGVTATAGSWIVFTDDDCIPDSGWLAAFAAAINASDAKVFEGRTYTENIGKGPFWGAPENKCGGLLWSCNFAINKCTFLEVGQFDDGFPYPHLEDVDLRERLKTAGQAIVFCRKAGVFHPLRAAPPAIRQAMGYESYFYYARKHNISLRQAGLSLRLYIKTRQLSLHSLRTASDLLQFTWRTALETMLMLALCPWWFIKQRSRKR